MTDSSQGAIVLGFPEYEAQARALATALALPYATIAIHRFPDGESCVRLPDTLPSRIILCRSLDHPNDKLVELQLATATARLAGVQHITLVAPYLCYMRQDIAFRPGEAVSQRIIGHWLAQQVDAVVTVDPHLHRVATLGEAIPTGQAVCLSAAELIGRYIHSELPHAMLIGPDEESRQWVASAARAADTDYCVATKQRHSDREISIELPAQNYQGRDIVLVDDVASTGQTLLEATRLLYGKGARAVYAAVTHALFVEDADAQLLQAGIRRIWSTDSIAHTSNALHLHVLLADAIQQLLTD